MNNYPITLHKWRLDDNHLTQLKYTTNTHAQKTNKNKVNGREERGGASLHHLCRDTSRLGSHQGFFPAGGEYSHLGVSDLYIALPPCYTPSLSVSTRHRQKLTFVYKCNSSFLLIFKFVLPQ